MRTVSVPFLCDLCCMLLASCQLPFCVCACVYHPHQNVLNKYIGGANCDTRLVAAMQQPFAYFCECRYVCIVLLYIHRGIDKLFQVYVCVTLLMCV